MSTISNLTAILQAAGVASQSLPSVLSGIGTVFGNQASAQVGPMVSKLQSYIVLGNAAGVAATVTELEGVPGLSLTAALILEKIRTTTDMHDALDLLTNFQAIVSSSASTLATTLQRIPAVTTPAG